MAQTLSSRRQWRRELSILLAQSATPATLSPAPCASCWPNHRPLKLQGNKEVHWAIFAAASSIEVVLTPSRRDALTPSQDAARTAEAGPSGCSARLPLGFLQPRALHRNKSIFQKATPVTLGSSSTTSGGRAPRASAWWPASRPSLARPPQQHEKLVGADPQLSWQDPTQSPGCDLRPAPGTEEYHRCQARDPEAGIPALEQTPSEVSGRGCCAQQPRGGLVTENLAALGPEASSAELHFLERPVQPGATSKKKKVSFGKENHNNHSTFLKLETKNIKSAMDPYKADDSREEEEENDEDNSLEGNEAMPPPPQSTGLSPKGASMDAQDHRERDTEMFRKPSCSQLTGYTLGRDTSTVEGAAQASL
ncbi:hypothetical protein QTO34_001354 [Cnephaeus nilssonii]|uniref:Uncharacterized protein n=1 Tax=Cnephaeus nilssonii TaxID=3371016 RepID=A0AA40HWJ8_CNENI|nr:hypothetical protein QTO34_001354 [Eptesicus nilssonii]